MNQTKHNAFTIIGICEGGLFSVFGLGFGIASIFTMNTDKFLVMIIASLAYGIPGALLLRRSKTSVWVMAVLGMLYLCAPLGMVGHKGNGDSVFSSNLIAIAIFCGIFGVINWIGFYVGYNNLRDIRRIV